MQGEAQATVIMKQRGKTYIALFIDIIFYVFINKYKILSIFFTILIINDKIDYICSMTSIITGDIIGSRKLTDQGLWMDSLKVLFKEEGASPKAWDIHRGDNFQLEVTQPERALCVALQIKSLVKSKAGIDARMAIGIGKKDFSAPRIAESNGEAFVLSGGKYDALKKEKTSLAIATPWTDINRQLGLIIRLGLIAIDSWSRMSAEYVSLRLAHPEFNQLQVAEKLGISQSSASARHKRSFYDEIRKMELYYRELISQKLKP